ncbi:MAG: hypothetical protein EOP06_11295, partial [Proteobacteria bacterium]
MKRQIVIAMVLVGSALGAHAQDAQKPEETGNVIKLDTSGQAAPTKDIDDEITNARMRASLGSKNRWSFKSALGYSGGSVLKPLEDVRPNYRAGANRESLPGLSGTIGVNYRLTERDNLSAGTGITIVDPFHGNIGQSATDNRKGAGGTPVDRAQISTPSIGWSRGYKAMGSQM